MVATLARSVANITNLLFWPLPEPSARWCSGLWPEPPFPSGKYCKTERQLSATTPPLPPSTPKRTPPRAPLQPPNPINTPKRSQDIQVALNNARGYTSPTNRCVRSLLNKLGQVVDRDAVDKAQLKAEVERLKEEMCSLEPRTRKRVREPANDRFAGIKEIAEAEEASVTG